MLRKDRPCILLQKICLFILCKLKAFRKSQHDHIYFNEITFDADNFMRNLFDSKYTITKEFNRETKTLLIGRKEMNDFLEDKSINNYMNFNTQFCIQDGKDFSGRSHYSIYGLKVHVIPWMEGMLLLQGEYNPN